MARSRKARLSCRRLAVSESARCAFFHKSAFASPWAAAEFESLLADASVVADGVFGSGSMAGFVVSRRAADEAEILTIAVDPSKRGRGLATSLLGYHLSRLAQLGTAVLFLEVEEANKPALALYRHFGFAQVGRRQSYYRKADGGRADALILRRDL